MSGATQHGYLFSVDREREVDWDRVWAWASELCPSGVRTCSLHTTSPKRRTESLRRARRWIHGGAQVRSLGLGGEQSSSSGLNVCRESGRLVVSVGGLPIRAALPTHNPLDAIELTGFSGFAKPEPSLFWDAIDSAGTHEQAGWPIGELPRLPHRDGFPPFLQQVDLSGRPGRPLDLPGVTFAPAWRMWFGPNAEQWMPRARLVQFADAHRIEEHPHGVLFIELFPDIEDSETPAGLARMQAFRDWMGFDELERRAPYLLGQAADPGLEIDHGSFPHGGEIRWMEWLTEDMQPSRRSEAAVLRVTEFDRDMRIIHQETSESVSG